MADVAMAARFLDHLYSGLPGEIIEFRLIRGKEVRRFYSVLPVPTSDLEALAQWNEAGWNIYFGVLTRSRLGGSDWHPIYAPAAWADIDIKSQRKTLIDPKAAIILNLLGSETKPDLMVDSGNGVHAYWRVIVPPPEHKRLSDINRRLAKKFGGDHVHDMMRILRLPGYDNVKSSDRPVSTSVLVEPVSGNMYMELDEMERRLADIDIPALDAKLADLIEHGNQGEYPSRSEADFAVVIGMLRAGYAQDEIRKTFETKPIGDRYREKGPLGEDYLARTIEAAHRRVKGENRG